MAQLVGLNVTAVAFVHRGANRKKFFLTKSKHKPNDGGLKGDEMNKVIKEKLQALMKSDEHKDSSADKLLEALKADEAIKKLELSDEDFVEVKQDIEFFKSLAPAAPAAPEKTEKSNVNNGDVKDETITDLQKSVKSLTETLEKQQDQLRLTEIRRHLAEKAPYAPIDVKQESELILTLEKTSSDAAKRTLEQFERTSAIIERTGALEELGTSFGGSDSPVAGSEVMAEISKGREDLEKSEKGLTPQGEIEMITRIMKSKGNTYYDQYVLDHRNRSRTGGLSLRAVG